jgi:hypothetical protein
MVILVALAILATPYLVARVLRTQHASTPRTAHPQEARAEVSGVAGSASHDGPTWSALDDRQLTRLLTNSAPRSTTE